MLRREYCVMKLAYEKPVLVKRETLAEITADCVGASHCVIGAA